MNRSCFKCSTDSQLIIPDMIYMEIQMRCLSKVPVHLPRPPTYFLISQYSPRLTEIDLPR